MNVTRSGKAVTLINLSLTEPETVFRVFNEIFYLMTIPSLDKFFRNPETGKLKEIMGFVVDNGPSEAPASFLVQMLLVRLLKFLDLDKVTQRSFAEYLSKRNCRASSCSRKQFSIKSWTFLFKDDPRECAPMKSRTQGKHGKYGRRSDQVY